MKMNKTGAGEIGKLLVSFPIILLIFIIMGIFVFVSSVLSIGGGGGRAFSNSVVTQDELMLKKVDVKIDLGDGKSEIRSMRVIDAVKLVLEGKISVDKIPLRGLMDKENNCLLISRSVTPDLSSRINEYQIALVIYLVNQNGQIYNAGPTAPSSPTGIYLKNKALKSISFEVMKEDGNGNKVSTKFYVDYYYGGCLG